MGTFLRRQLYFRVNKPLQLNPIYEQITKLSAKMSRNYPENTSSRPPSLPASSSWAVPSTVSHAVTGLLRRFSTEPSSSKNGSPVHSPTFGATRPNHHQNGMDGRLFRGVGRGLVQSTRALASWSYCKTALQS